MRKLRLREVQRLPGVSKCLEGSCRHIFCNDNVSCYHHREQQMMLPSRLPWALCRTMNPQGQPPALQQAYCRYRCKEGAAVTATYRPKRGSEAKQLAQGGPGQCSRAVSELHLATSASKPVSLCPSLGKLRSPTSYTVQNPTVRRSAVSAPQPRGSLLRPRIQRGLPGSPGGLGRGRARETRGHFRRRAVCRGECLGVRIESRACETRPRGRVWGGNPRPQLGRSPGRVSIQLLARPVD